MSSPHIFTLTGNLLAERTLVLDEWAPGRTQRARSESFQVGGKGINVAKMLRRLGAPHTALCFTGGAPGLECAEWLRQRGFAFRAFATAAPTRCGTVVRDRSGAHRETTFLGPDAAPDAAAVQACADFLDAQPAGEVLAVCGSLPGWPEAAFDPLRAALQRWMERGPLVVDTYGPPLRWFAARPVALVKINAAELRPLAPALAELPATVAAQRWIVTDGGGPVEIRDRDRAVVTLTPPVVAEVSPTGSGDVLLACVLEALFRRGATLREAVVFALPYAAANAAHPGIAEFAEQELRSFEKLT